MHLLVRVQNSLVIKYFAKSLSDQKGAGSLVRLGTEYGGWWVPEKMLHIESQEWSVISIGLGHDVSFDKEITNHGIPVIGLDPLQSCIAYANKEIGSNEKLTLINKGIWTQSGKRIFFAPKNITHDSWSITNTQMTSSKDSIEFEVISLKDLRKSHSSILDKKKLYLKMDIEGSEEKIIEQIISDSMIFDFLAIEMDYLSLIPFFGLKRRIKAIATARQQLSNLRKLGYKLCHVENFNFFWRYAGHV